MVREGWSRCQTLLRKRGWGARALEEEGPHLALAMAVTLGSISAEMVPARELRIWERVRYLLRPRRAQPRPSKREKR